MIRRWALLFLVVGAIARAAELTLEFELRWAGRPLALPAAEVTNASGQALRFTRVAGLVSGVTLRRADGGTVQLEGQYGYVDFAAGRTRFTLHNVPAGDYAGLAFQIGLPAAVNRGDVARWPAGHALHPLVNGLHWSWQGGYVFLALEGRWAPQAGGEFAGGFLYHLATPARAMPVQFAAMFPVRENTVIRLAFDLARVLHDVRIDAERGTESTHSGEGDPLAPQLAAAVERAWFWLEAREEAAAPRAPAGAMMAGEIETAAARGSRVAGAGPTPRAFVVPAGFPQPALPADNPLTDQGVALGQRLFHDVRLSGNGTQSCASCHAPERAFSDGRALSSGARGTAGTRNAMPLFNLAWSERFAWDGTQPTIRDQSLAAMRNPIEMDAEPAAVVAALAADAEVRGAFAAAFGSPEITAERIGLALEQFQLTLVSADSRFDRAVRGAAELTAEEKRGFELFLTEYDPRRGRNGADCFHCHGGALFSDYGFRNNGLPRRAAQPDDHGLERATGKADDRGKFKTPSLRNVAVTGPYMHDGRFATLEDVVAHYSGSMERTATLDANLAKHPAAGIQLAPEDQRALVAFLRTLTDSAYDVPAAASPAQ